MFFRYLLKLPRNVRDIVHYSRAFSRKEHTGMRVIRVDTDEYLTAAKKLHADVYLGRRFVDAADIVDGMLSRKADPHQRHSQYFIVTDKATDELVATARQIQAVGKKGHGSFAMVNQAHLYPHMLRRIRTHAPEACVEISALAKRRGASKLAPLLLYRALWHHSLREKHSLWLLAIDVRLFARLKLLFGPAIQKAGKVTPYYGGNVVPAILKVQSSIVALNSSLHKAHFMQRKLRSLVVRFVLTGLPVASLNVHERRVYEKLRHELGMAGEAIAEPVIKKPGRSRKTVRTVAIVVSLVYTAVRFGFVKIGLEAYGVNPWIFLTLDAIAGVVYVLAIEHLIVGIIGRQKQSLKANLMWVVVAVAAFAAPYIYIYLSSKQLPLGFGIGIAVLTGLLLLSAVNDVVRRVRRKSG